MKGLLVAFAVTTCVPVLFILFIVFGSPMGQTATPGECRAAAGATLNKCLARISSSMGGNPPAGTEQRKCFTDYQSSYRRCG